MFKNVLQDIFEDENFGKAILKEPNLYLNNALLVQQKVKLVMQEESFDSVSNILNKIFKKDKFFELAKQGKLNIKNQNQIDQINQNDNTKQISQEDQSLIYQIILQFFEKCNNYQSTPKPLFAQQTRANNVLMLQQIKISDQVAKAIAEFLESGKNIKQFQVKQLVIDECQMSDENFACILKSCIKQGNCLKSIIYQSNYFDEKAAEQIKILIPNLFKFSFSNPTNKFLKVGVLRDITDCIQQNAKFLQKLKFTKLQIRDSKVFENILEFVQGSSLLQELDLSWTALKPKQLAKISEAILNNPYKLRKLNLSYNALRLFDGSQEDQILSNQFLNNLESFFKVSTTINHIDLSGMNLNGKPLLKLAKQLVVTPFMAVIHLNDNNIMNGNEIYIHELLDIFGTEIVKERNEIDQKFKKNPILKNSEIIKNKVFTFLNNKKTKENNYMTFVEKDLKLKKQQKDLILKTLAINHIKDDLLINQREGCGRGAGGTVYENFQDYLTLSRKVNMPELIFNLGFHSEEYFEANHANNWQATFNSECFVCDYHRFVVIMYDQGVDNNKELIEIKDLEFLKQVQEHCNEQFRPQNVADVPVILGTVVQQAGSENIKIGPYQRQIKMLKGEFFSLLACCQAAQFTKKPKVGNKIKKAVITFTENRQQITQQVINDLLKGWEHNLINYIKENQVHEVFVVNFPDYLNKKYEQRKLDSQQPVQKTSSQNELDKIDTVLGKKLFLEKQQKAKNDKLKNEVTHDSIFCFAAYLPPGYHHFLIYDHATQRVFIKEIIVPLRNSTFIYPDQIQNNLQIRPPRVNVWRLWVQDTPETETLVYTNDLTSGLYEPQLLIKSQELLEQVKEFQMNRRSDYKIFYRELVARSFNYPKISFLELYHILKYFMNKEEIDLPRAYVELSFQKSIRKQNVSLLTGRICRAELMDFIIRIVERLNAKDIFNTLIHFTDKHIKPIADSSQIPQHRKQIRSCLRTNDLLQKNKTFLEEIFYASKEGFTRKVAVNLICTNLQNNLVHPMPEEYSSWIPDQPPQQFSPPCDPLDSQLPTEIVLRCFSYSLMTIINEQTHYKKYNYCYYVEFLEFICRIAINLYSNFKQISLYEKTKNLLEILLIRYNFIKERANAAWKVIIKKKQDKTEEEGYQIMEVSDHSDFD